MSRVRRVAAIAIGVVLCLSVSRSVAADPIVITSGVLGFSANSSVDVDLSGPSFFLGGADTNPEDFGLPGLGIDRTDPSAAFFPISGHIIVNLTAHLTAAGAPTENCCSNEVVLDLLFSGPDALAGASELQCGVPCRVIAGSAPFAVAGEIRAFRGPGDEIFRSTLVGSGTATVGFTIVEGFGPRAFATFDFEPLASTPEPATLLLLASGAAGLRWRSRRTAVPASESG